jgi:hypothetical protein
VYHLHIYTTYYGIRRHWKDMIVRVS